MNGTGPDYAAAALLLGGAALVGGLAVRRLRGRARWLALAGVAGMTLLIWADGAVGVFN